MPPTTFDSCTIKSSARATAGATVANGVPRGRRDLNAGRWDCGRSGAMNTCVDPSSRTSPLHQCGWIATAAATLTRKTLRHRAPSPGGLNLPGGRGCAAGSCCPAPPGHQCRHAHHRYDNRGTAESGCGTTAPRWRTKTADSADGFPAEAPVYAGRWDGPQCARRGGPAAQSVVTSLILPDPVVDFVSLR